MAIIERTGLLTGRALATLGAICDLRFAVIGGSVALGFGDPFFNAARAELDQRARLSFTSGFRVEPARLGALAPLVGAAALVHRVDW
jgi:glucokinase